MNIKKLIIALAISSIFLLCVFSVLFVLKQNRKAMPNELGQLSSLPIGGDFTINYQDLTFDLKDYRKKVVVLFFGFTYCPDICPTTLSTMASTLKRFSPEQRKQIQVIFISLDPKRDSLARLKEYTGFFNKNFISLTDTEENIAKIAKMYAVGYEKFYPKNKSADEYTIDHSTQSFIIDKAGQVTELIKHGSTQSLIKTQINRYLD